MRGHVRKRGSKWVVVVDIGRDENGKRKQKWHSGFERRRDAEAALAEIIGRVEKGSYVESSKITVGAYLTERWLPAIKTRVRPSTHDSYRRNVQRHLVKRIGNLRLQQLSGDALNAMYAECIESGRRDGKGLSPRTVRYLHAIMHRALADAMRWRLVTRNVAEQADPPRQRRNRAAIATWTAPQLRAFLEHVREDRLYALWHLLASTGMRRGEALGLALDSVDLDAKRLAVTRALIAIGYEIEFSEPKTERGRRNVALDSQTVAALRAHRKDQIAEQLALGPAYEDRGLVFCCEDGTPIHPDRASKLFAQHVKAAGLPRIRLHDLRHTHATLALAAGVHPKVVSERLGHSSIAITLDTYSHAIPALQEEAASAVAALIQ